MFDPDNSEDKQVSTFQQLELACLELDEVLYKVHIVSVANAGDLPNGFKPVYRGFVYSRMLWSKLLVNSFLRHYTKETLYANNFSNYYWLVRHYHVLLMQSEICTHVIGTTLCNVGAMSVKNLVTLEMGTKILIEWKWVILFLFSISFLTTASTVVKVILYATFELVY